MTATVTHAARAGARAYRGGAGSARARAGARGCRSPPSGSACDRLFCPLREFGYSRIAEPLVMSAEAPPASGSPASLRLVVAAAAGAALGAAATYAVVSRASGASFPLLPRVSLPVWLQAALGLLPDPEVDFPDAPGPRVGEEAEGRGDFADRGRSGRDSALGRGVAVSGEAAEVVSGSVPSSSPSGLPSPGTPTVPLPLDSDPILCEHLTRNLQFFGERAQRAISSSFVVVVGVGGVGSHAAHMLARSGVARLRLVDFDQVTVSSLNRHAVATRADVGVSKVDCLKRHLAEIVPEVAVEAVNALFPAEDDALGRRLLSLDGPHSEGGQADGAAAGDGEGGGLCVSGGSSGVCGSSRPSYVLDAIDNIESKVALVALCRAAGVPVLSCAGAGAKADPTRLRVADLSEAFADPLARALRTRLRRDRGVEGGCKVLLSTEPPRAALVFGGAEGSDPKEYAVLPGFRARTIPVLGTSPAQFGCAAAGLILCALGGFELLHEPPIVLDERAYKTQLDRLQAREEERTREARLASSHAEESDGDGDGAAPAEVVLPVDLADVRVLVRYVWRATSAFADPTKAVAGRRGVGRPVGHLALTRWRADQPPVPSNLVLLTKEEADEHDARGGATNAWKREHPEIVKRVEEGLDRARRELEDGLWPGHV